MPCPFCEGTVFEPLKSFSEGVVVGRCSACGLIYTPHHHPAPHGLFQDVSPATLRVLYDGIVSGRVPHFRAASFSQYLAILRRHGAAGRLLDVGCAHGFFALAARDAGYEVTGLEPSAGMASFARETLGLRVLEGTLAEISLGEEEWDVITFTDSLEYLPDPVNDLRRALDHLRPGGHLFVKVPNGDYFLFMSSLETRGLAPCGDGAFTPSRRVVHYTRRTLRRLMESLGLDVITVGHCRPISMPPWRSLTGLSLEVAPPWWLRPGPRIARWLLHGLGRLESAMTGGRKNHLSQSVYIVARKSDPEVG
jgi:SAM-dependent methyltransferase